MISSIRFRSLVVIFLLMHFCSFAQGFLKVNGTEIVSPKGEKIILRGMGLGGWMLQEGYMLQINGIGQQQHVIKKHIEDVIGKQKTKEFYDAWLANHTRKIDIDSLAAWGFNSVRLPMHYNLFTLPADEEPVPDQNTWLEKGFALTDSLLRWCAANKMYLILDLHGAPGGQGNDNNIADRDPSKPALWQSEVNQNKTIALWRKLASRYANEPWIGGYDIINEPNWGFEKTDDRNGCQETKNEPLRKLLVAISSAIREVDKNHIIIIEGNCWGNNYAGVFPLWDNNMAISFHKYWNYNDQAAIQKFTDIRKQLNAPVWLGESGENSNLWYRDAIHLAEENEIGWAWWPLKKLGSNNPLEVKMPNSYLQLLNYWRKRGEKPTSEDAFKGLMQLAENLKLENCIYHRDVVDAMFRQTRTNQTVPFKTHIARAGEIVAATDYDLGRNGYAYFDKDTANYWTANGGAHTDGNKGHAYRNDGVDISPENNQFFVDSFEAGEWFQFTVTCYEPKTYEVALIVRNTTAATVELFGESKSVLEVPADGLWHEVSAKKMLLKEGENVIRIKVLRGSIQLQSFQFK